MINFQNNLGHTTQLSDVIDHIIDILIKKLKYLFFYHKCTIFMFSGIFLNIDYLYLKISPGLGTMALAYFDDVIFAQPPIITLISFYNEIST